MNRVSGGTAAWRFASRLAWREVRRRPGRTALVVVLVALPVLAMTVASVAARTGNVDSTLRQWRHGTDLVVAQDPWVAEDVTPSVPPASAVRSILTLDFTPIETSSGEQLEGVLVAGGVDELGGHVFAVTGGPAPGAGQAWLSTSLADRLGLATGDVLSLAHPKGTWTIAGVGRLETDFDRSTIVLDRFPLEQFRRDALPRLTSLIDLPGSPSEAAVASAGHALRQSIGAGDSDAVEWSEASSPRVGAVGLAWGWVAGVIALAATGIIIAAAFATTARRQLVTIGLLSANGASERLTRRVLALQGFWTGVLGAGAGIAVGLVGLVAGRSTIERVVGHVFAPYQFAVFDLVVIGLTGIAAATIAALVPARTATRAPVTAALAGRRPLAAVPRWLVPIGIVLFVLGTLLLVVAAGTDRGGNAAASAAVVGGVLVLAGACCASPMAIDIMSRASSRVGRSWRFAGRSLGRTRYRSAAVVTAITVAGAAAVAGSAQALSADGQPTRFLPGDAVVLSAVVEWPDATGRPRMLDFESAPSHPVDAELRSAVEAVLPASEWFPLRMATWDPAPYRVNRGPRAEHGGAAITPDSELVVADPAVLDLYELEGSERDALESTGVLRLDPWGPDSYDGQRRDTITLATEDGDITLPVAARDWVVDQLEQPDGEVGFDGVRGVHAFMITEEAARRAGLDVVRRGAIVRAGATMTGGQANAINEVTYGGDWLGYYYRDVPRPGGSSTWNVSYDETTWDPPPAVVQAAIVGAALLLTLLVVAIGLSLAATEGRDERDVLVAIGARPATMRRMAGVKAAVITLTGVLIAIPTGVIPVAAVRRTLDEPFVIPWLAIAGLVLVVPAVAGLAAWAASSIAQRIRPTRMSTLAFE